MLWHCLNRLQFFMLTALAVCAVLCASGAASAQTKVLGAAEVNEDTQAVELGPYAIIQKDPDQKITPDTIRSSGGRALTGKLYDSPVVFLGHDGVPTWLSIKIANTGKTADWIIDLGRRSDGRFGYIKSVRAYEFGLLEDGTVSLTNIPSYAGNGTYKIRLDQGQQKLVLFDITGAAGIPSIVPLKLYSEKSFAEHAENRASINTVVSMMLSGIALCFLFPALSRRRAEFIPYAMYFFYVMSAWVLYDLLGSAAKGGIFSSMILCMILGYVLLSIFITRSFCGIDQASFTERYILIGLAWLNVMGTVLSFFLPVGSGTTHVSLLYGAPAFTLAILALMGYAQARNGQIPGYLFSLSWLFPLFGLAVSVLGACGAFPYNGFIINAFWYAAVPQGVLFLMALRQKTMKDTSYSGMALGSDSLNLTGLKETKDSAEHARLLKVIEKERQLLAEFRHQDAVRVEQMRRAKEEADEANRAKSAFLAVVSHEIRTPMTGIMGMVRLLLDSSITKQQRDHVLTIQESGEAMLGLLNDILDFEKIQRGKLDLESISFDLHRLIQGIVNLMSGHATQKSITLSARMDEEIPRYVRGDPTRLRQVLLNFLGNAIKFTQEGSVTLFVKSLDQNDPENPTYNDRHMIYFGIQDTGIGIPLEAQANLFNPFTQVNSSITRKFGGTGLGLAISKGLIEAMGSSVNINSKEGEGSTFFFTLALPRGNAPQVSEAMRVSPTEAATLTPARPLKVLVVDDNAINCKVARSFLELDKHEVKTTSSAESALEIIQKENFDVILMDIELPGMSGNEAIKLLRDHPNPAKANIPAIALTGNVAKEDMERYLADGMNGFLAKPIDADKLKLMMSEISHKSHEREFKPLGGNAAKNDKDDLGDISVALELADPDEIIEAPKQPKAEIKDMASAGNGLSPVDPSMALEESTSAVFNAGMLDSLKHTLGKDQLMQLLEEVFDKADEILQAMEKAVQENDLIALYARAHELKGMTGNFGLVEISDLAAQTETGAKANQKDSIATLIRRLPHANSRARAELGKWIAE